MPNKESEPGFQVLQVTLIVGQILYLWEQRGRICWGQI